MSDPCCKIAVPDVAVDPANKTSLWSIPDQMSRSAEEGASKHTTDTITGRGYGFEGKRPAGGPGGQDDQGRLVID